MCENGFFGDREIYELNILNKTVKKFSGHSKENQQKEILTQY